MEKKNKSGFFNDTKKAISVGIAGLLVVFACLAVFLIAQTIETLDGNGQHPSNVITVSGEGEVLAVPDIATFDYTVREVADNVEAAQAEATSKSNRVIAILEEKGIEDADIKTTNYNIQPRYEWQQEACLPGQDCRGGRNVIVGQEVSQTVEVKVRDTEKAGEILSEIGQQEVSNVSSLRFSIDDEDVLKTEARELAINEAMEKAEKLATQLGVKIEGVVSFHEDQGYDYPMGMGGDASYRSEAVMMDSAPELPSGENAVTTRVSITFEIKG